MAMQTIQEKVKKNPYIGPRPFGRNLYDQLRFFGRSFETEEILTQILSHQLVLIYSQSGAGKTSILNAKVIPELEKEGFEVLPIARVGVSSDAFVSADNDSKNNHIIISNHYMLNALWSIKPDIDPKLLLNKSLCDFINEYFSTNDGDVNDLHFSKVIIFDQLEELFSIFSKKWHEEQIMFFKQITDALNKDPQLRIVFVIREDYLAQLDPFTKILPEKLRPRFRLERLHKEAAIQAIKGPLQRANYDVPINEIEQIVQDLMKIKVENITGNSLDVTGEFVEPIQLQVVCQRWWYERFISKTVHKDTTYLSDLTNVDRSLEDFYIKCIQNAVKKTNVKEEDLRKWCEENLITSSGTRSNIHLESKVTKGIPNKTIEIMADSYLIRREWRAGAYWYELTHDRLINPIKESNKNWFNKKIKTKRAFRIKIAVPITIIFIICISLYISSIQENYQNQLAQKRLELQQEQELVKSDRLVLQSLTNGINYFRLGDFQQAILEFNKALSINKSSTEAAFYKELTLDRLNLQYLTNGINYFGLGDFQQAILEFNKALSINPNFTEALFYKGLTLQKLSKFNESKFYYDKLNTIDPGYIDTLTNTNSTLVDLDSKDKETITWYDKALEVEPTNTDALNNKGNALQILGNYTEAMAYYDKTLEVDPTNTDALNNKGNALQILGNYVEAIEYYDKALAVDPTNTDALNNKGNALQDLGKNVEAIEYYDKALEVEPTNTDALNNKGNALQILGNYAEAITWYDKALAVDPNDSDALNSKGNALQNLGEYDEAITWYDKALAVDPNDSDALNSKGNALQNLGEYDEAITWYDKALAVDPNDSDALNSKGNALQNLGEYDEAITWYDKALAVDPNDSYALNSKAFALANLDKNEEALPIIKRGLEYAPNDEYFLATAAFIMHNLGRDNEAKSYYEKALAINPNLMEILEEKELSIFNELMNNNNTKQ